MSANSTSRPLEDDPAVTTAVILAGYTRGDWAAVSAGEGDFAVTALRFDGEELWRWQVRTICSKDSSERENIPCFLCWSVTDSAE